MYCSVLQTLSIHTVRHARDVDVPVLLLLPDGNVQ